MCYAIPARIERIRGDDATVDYGGVRKEVKISLVEGLKEGDYVYIHAGFAIERLNRKSAEEALEIIAKDFERINEDG